MIVKPGHDGKVFRLVRKGSRQSVEIGTVVRDRDGEEFGVTGGSAPGRLGKTGIVYLVRPGTSTVHEVYPGMFGFEWVEHGVDRRKE